MLLNKQLVLAAVRCREQEADKFSDHLSRACQAYSINTPHRLAAFVAQVAHESGSFRYVREIWGPTATQIGYEGRKDLGNVSPGDGERFKGRGLIQITGRSNYAQMRDVLREIRSDAPDFEVMPEALESDEWACWSAAAFWDSRHLNPLADAGQFEIITKRINGGLIGIEDRLKRWDLAKKAISECQEPSQEPIQESIQTIPAGEVLPEQPSKPMAPIIAALLPSLVEAIPKLGQIFAKSDVSQRNVKAAEIAFSVAKEALGATNEQEVVQRVQADPAAAQAVAKAVEASWYVITQEVGGGISAARDADAKFTANGERGFWHSPAFWISVGLLGMPVGLVLDFLFFHPGNYDSNLRTQIVTALLGVITVVAGYWIGTSASSQRKTELMNK